MRFLFCSGGIGNNYTATPVVYRQEPSTPVSKTDAWKSGIDIDTADLIKDDAADQKYSRDTFKAYLQSPAGYPNLTDEQITNVLDHFFPAAADTAQGAGGARTQNMNEAEYTRQIGGNEVYQSQKELYRILFGKNNPSVTELNGMGAKILDAANANPPKITHGQLAQALAFVGQSIAGNINNVLADDMGAIVEAYAKTLTPPITNEDKIKIIITNLASVTESARNNPKELKILSELLTKGSGVLDKMIDVLAISLKATNEKDLPASLVEQGIIQAFIDGKDNQGLIDALQEYNQTFIPPEKYRAFIEFIKDNPNDPRAQELGLHILFPSLYDLSAEDVAREVTNFTGIPPDPQRSASVTKFVDTIREENERIREGINSGEITATDSDRERFKQDSEIYQGVADNLKGQPGLEGLADAFGRAAQAARDLSNTIGQILQNNSAPSAQNTSVQAAAGNATPGVGGGASTAISGGANSFTASPLEKASQQKQQAEALTREAQEFEKEIEANIEAAKANAKAIEENTAAASAELKEINKTTSANREASLALDQRLLAVLSAQKELAGLAQNMAAVLAGDAGADFPRLTADERGALLENIKNIMYAARESVVSIQEIRQTSNSAEQVPVKVNMPDTGRIEQAMEQTIQAAPVIEKILIELTNNDIQLTAVKSFSAHYDIQIQYAKHLTELSEFAEKQESRQAEAIRQQQKEAYKETLNIYYRALLGEITAEEVKVLKAQRDIISDDWTERNKLQKEINSRESQIKYPLLMTAVDKLLDKLPQELQDFFETMLDSSADIQTVYLALDRTLQKFKETLKSKDLSLDELKRLKDNYADSAEIAKIIQEVINEQQKQLEPAAA